MASMISKLLTTRSILASSTVETCMVMELKRPIIIFTEACSSMVNTMDLEDLKILNLRLFTKETLKKDINKVLAKNMGQKTTLTCTSMKDIG